MYKILTVKKLVHLPVYFTLGLKFKTSKLSGNDSSVIFHPDPNCKCDVTVSVSHVELGQFCTTHVIFQLVS